MFTRLERTNGLTQEQYDIVGRMVTDCHHTYSERYMAQAADCSVTSVRKIIQRIAESNPEWIRGPKAHAGRPKRVVSDEDIATVKRLIDLFSKPCYKEATQLYKDIWVFILTPEAERDTCYSDETKQKMLSFVNSPPSISEHKFAEAYRQLGQMRTAPVQPVNKVHLWRADANLVLAIVQTDLHTISPPYVFEGHEYKYIIAFIDNKSRFIIHWAFLEDKTSQSTSAECRICWDKCGEFGFGRLHTDNGREFAGDFSQFILVERQTQLTFSTPYEPEENGKIERFWHTLQFRITYENQYDYSKVGTAIDAYNELHRHASLLFYDIPAVPAMGNIPARPAICCQRPKQAYTRLEKWVPGRPIELVARTDLMNQEENHTHITIFNFADNSMVFQ